MMEEGIIFVIVLMNIRSTDFSWGPIATNTFSSAS